MTAGPWTVADVAAALTAAGNTLRDQHTTRVDGCFVDACPHHQPHPGTRTARTVTAHLRGATR